MVRPLIKNFKLLKGLPLFFILIGIFLRTWNFSSALFASDEALHMTRAVSVSRGIVDLLKLDNPPIALRNIFLPILQHNHPPTEFLLSIPAVPFQPREFSARGIHLFVSILFMPAIYLLLLKIRNKKFALFFLALFSTSMFAVWWSRTISHDVLAIMQGILLGVSLIYFLKKPGNTSFFLMMLAFVGAMYIIMDFAVYLPILIFVSFRNRKFISRKNVIKSLLICAVILGIYYIPYIVYAFLPNSSHSSGFNYYLYGKLNKDLSIVALLQNIPLQLKAYYTNFFSQSGIFPAWIFALLSILYLRKKNKYIEIFASIIFIYFLINLFFPTTLFFYKDFYGLILLLSAEWLYSKKKLGYALLMVTIIINLYGSLPLFKGVHNYVFNTYLTNDNLDKIGLFSKNCLTGNESYVSTVDYWRTEYYFGRQPLPRLNSGFSIQETVAKFIEGQYRNDIYLIHFREGNFDEDTIRKLREIAKREIVIDKDHAFLFKNCAYEL